MQPTRSSATISKHGSGGDARIRADPREAPSGGRRLRGVRPARRFGFDAGRRAFPSRHRANAGASVEFASEARRRNRMPASGTVGSFTSTTNRRPASSIPGRPSVDSPAGVSEVPLVRRRPARIAGRLPGLCRPCAHSRASADDAAVARSTDSIVLELATTARAHLPAAGDRGSLASAGQTKFETATRADFRLKSGDKSGR